LQEPFDCGPEGGDRFAFAPAVAFAVVDVIFVRDAAPPQGRDDQFRLCGRDNRVDRALEDRDGVADLVSVVDRRAVAVTVADLPR